MQARNSAEAAKSAANLARQQLRATEAAIVECIPAFFSDNLFSVQCRNTGRSIAKGLEGNFTLQAVTFPGLRPVSAPISHSFSQAQVPIGGGRGNLKSVPLDLLALRNSIVEKMIKSQTIRVTGSYRYDDGCSVTKDDITVVTVDSCFFKFFTIKADGSRANNGEGFAPCDALEGKIRDNDKAQRRENESRRP